MEAYSSNLFEDIRYERSLILLSSITDSDISEQSKFIDEETNITKKLALKKLHRQKCSKEFYAFSLLE